MKNVMLEDLLIEFDEMAFIPDVLVPNPDEYARDYKRRLTEAITEQEKEIESKYKERIANLKYSLSKKTMEYELLKCGKRIGNGIVEVATKTKNRLELYNFAERVKMEFYAYFDELIPSIMADKIDEILKEFTGQEEAK